MSGERLNYYKKILDSLGPTKLSDVEKAQNEIVQKAKDLEASGKAFISRGKDGDALV